MEEYVKGRRNEKKARGEFAGADLDHDNKLSREEWVLKFGNDKLFDAYDLDGDGVISPEEYMRGRMHELNLEEIAGKDRKLTREEWIARYGHDFDFDKYDLNHDGIIDPDEWVQSMTDYGFRQRSCKEVGVAHDELQELQSKYKSQKVGKISKAQWVARYNTERGFDEYLESHHTNPDEFLHEQPRGPRWDRRHAPQGPFVVPAWDGIPVQTLIPPKIEAPRGRVLRRPSSDPLDLDIFEPAADRILQDMLDKGREAFHCTPTGQYRSGAAKRYCGVGGGWRIAAKSEGGDGLFGQPAAGVVERGYSSQAAVPQYHYRRSAVEQIYAPRAPAPLYGAQPTLPNSLAAREVMQQQERSAAQSSTEAAEGLEWQAYTRGMRQPNSVRYN